MKASKWRCRIRNSVTTSDEMSLMTSPRARKGLRRENPAHADERLDIGGVRHGGDPLDEAAGEVALAADIAGDGTDGPDGRQPLNRRCVVRHGRLVLLSPCSGRGCGVGLPHARCTPRGSGVVTA